MVFACPFWLYTTCKDCEYGKEVMKREKIKNEFQIIRKCKYWIKYRDETIRMMEKLSEGKKSVSPLH